MQLEKSLMILVAGPYRSGTNDDPQLIAANVKAMTDAALEIYQIGHLPVPERLRLGLAMPIT